jgi:cbb3-type cytochrome oxidase subunit 3
VASHALGAIELALVFGGVVAWALWELRVTRRDRRESERRAAAQRSEDEKGTPRR